MQMDCILVVGVEAETTSERQTLGDKAKILLQCDICLDIVVPLIVVARLCRANPRIDIVLVECLGDDAVLLSGIEHAFSGIVAIGVHHRRVECVVAKELPPHLIVADARRVTLIQIATDTQFQ